MNARAAAHDPFAVPAWADRLGGSVERHARFWRGLGNFESTLFADHIENRPVDQPIYISGLARSGSTILLEILAEHPETATQAYRDFPLVYTPCLWNRFLDRAQRKAEAVERAHGDGILVTPDSPEAVEEVLWMGFFPHLHRPGVSDVLGATTDAPEFATFYRNHIRKLLWLRGGSRYLAKGNYNTTRIEYLRTLFPDARFIVPVREPVAHVASLVRQHARFCARHREDERARHYMRRLGHFEFGLDRRAVNTGNEQAAIAIEAAWALGSQAEGYAHAWADLYGYVADRLDALPTLRDAVLVVRHEDLCAEPERRLREVLDHCRLPADDAWVARMAARLKSGADRNDGLDPEQRADIERITAGTAVRYGYGGNGVRARRAAGAR